MLLIVKIAGSLAQNDPFAPIYPVSCPWCFCGLAVSMVETPKLLYSEGFKEVVILLCAAGMALYDIPASLMMCMFSIFFQIFCRVVLRGRRGTFWHSNLLDDVHKISLVGDSTLYEPLQSTPQILHSTLHTPPPHFTIHPRGSTRHTLQCKLSIPHPRLEKRERWVTVQLRYCCYPLPFTYVWQYAFVGFILLIFFKSKISQYTCGHAPDRGQQQGMERTHILQTWGHPPHIIQDMNGDNSVVSAKTLHKGVTTSPPCLGALPTCLLDKWKSHMFSHLTVISYAPLRQKLNSCSPTGAPPCMSLCQFPCFFAFGAGGTVHGLDCGFVLADHGFQVLACAGSCSSCVWPIFGLVLGSYCKDVSRSSSGDRLGSVSGAGALGAVHWTGAYFWAWQVVWGWQLRV